MTDSIPDPSVPNPTEHNQWYPFANRPLPPEVGGQAVNPAAIPVFDAVPLPSHARFVVVGAGVHGLSSAYHLAMYLERTGKGSGSDVVLIDKQGPGAGATGLACGCVRNMYMTGPLHAILRASVEVWESDPVNLGFQQVGYVSVGEANQTDDYLKPQASQAASGYPSDVYTGAEARAFLTNLWPDFKTDNCDVVLHEHRSGYAGTHLAVWGLDQKCRQWGVKRVYGATVTGYQFDNSGSVTAVETTQGSIACEQVVVGAGAWTPTHWEWLGGPSQLDVLYPDGHVEEQMDMWTYWRLLEGEVLLPPGVDFRTAQHRDSPVLHVELMNTPVYSPDGRFLKDHFYSYTRYAAERVGAPGLQGGTIPIKIGPRAAVEPYGHLNDEYQAEEWFADYYCATRHAVQAAGRPAALLQGAPQRRHRGVHPRQRAGVRLRGRQRLGDRRLQPRVQDDRGGQAHRRDDGVRRQARRAQAVHAGPLPHRRHVRRPQLQLPLGVAAGPVN